MRAPVPTRLYPGVVRPQRDPGQAGQGERGLSSASSARATTRLCFCSDVAAASSTYQKAAPCSE